jgi:glycosyltransferase involved in cell wall biosynthesis
MIENHQDVDIIHAHGLNASFVAAVLKKIFRKKALMSTMALYNFKPGALFSRISAGILSSLDKILAETVESKNELMSIGVPFVKIDVFSHWVNQDKFKPENKEIAKKRFGWEKKFIALFVGRAIPIKGGDTLTKVVEKIDCGINIAVISDAGPLLPTFRETAKKFKNFLFVGGVNYKDLHKYYKAADIFIIPSRYEEGAARVMMEAVCCGLPVIASNRGAIPSVLDSSVAVFVEPNEDEIGKAVNYLYSHPEKVKKLSKNCFSYGRKHFGFNNTKVVTANY